MKPDDKPKKTDDVFEDPRLFVVIGEESFPRTGLESAFIDYSSINAESTSVEAKSSETITYSGIMDSTRVTSYCLCFMISRAMTVCSCNKQRSVCDCHGYVSRSSGRTITTGCSCAPVH
ncbi:MAG: hypothetical protein LBF62_08895 [Tannerellaceae bacterium]|jgi:hypothetical protein|nr:hypothetical protein [Tannerellaceae bacterium]